MSAVLQEALELLEDERSDSEAWRAVAKRAYTLARSCSPRRSTARASGQSQTTRIETAMRTRPSTTGAVCCGGWKGRMSVHVVTAAGPQKDRRRPQEPWLRESPNRAPLDPQERCAPNGELAVATEREVISAASERPEKSVPVEQIA